MNVALEPHQDDLALFAAFEAQRLQTHVVTVLESHVQEQRGTGITQQIRRRENECAMRALGLPWEQWGFRDDRPDWDAVLERLRRLDAELSPETVLAPAPELGGHDQHNQVGDLAEQVFGDRVVFYLSYVRGHGRTEGRPSAFTADQVCRKLQALSCYRSQIAEPSCQPWFLEALTEYLA